jgi:rhomboid protease GluP
MTFLAPSDDSLFLLGATGYIPIGLFGRWWTVLTASFLHGGILHIFFNMAALAQLGPFVLSAFGAGRFLIIYILSGIAGFVLSYMAGVPLTIGASAGICGLIGAILYYGKSRGGYFGDAIYKQAIGWVIGLLVFGFIVPGINNWAHGGGIVTGILVGYLLGHEGKRSETMLDHALAGLAMVSTCAALLWAIVQAALNRLL